MGSTDKIVRLVLAAIMAVLYFTHVIEGTTAIILGALAIVFALTSVMSFCPLYLPLVFQHARRKRTMKHEIDIENLKCNGCANTIRTALGKIPLVDDVKIDVESEHLSINGDVSREVLLTRLNELGYPEKGNNNLLKQAKSYVSCAIGKIS